MVSEDKKNAFTSWLTQRGGYVNPKASLFHELPSGDRGVYATADIAEGEQLLLIPVNCTLHLEVTDARGTQLAATCDKDLAAFLTQQQQQQQPDDKQEQEQQQKPFSSFLATTLMLMSELAKGDASSYSAYFATLPEGTDCLINWTQQEQQLLAGTSLSDVTRSIRDIFEADIAPKLAARPDLFPEGCVSYDHFRRAADLVQTRAFHMSADNWLTGAHQESTDELYLIPAIDMLNHSTDPALRNTSLALCHGDVEVKLAGGQTKRFTNFFSMKAEKSIPEGTQILHTYGDLSDAQLLQTYGFIDVTPRQQQQQQQDAGEDQQQQQQQLSANPHNYVVLQLKDLLEAVKAVAAAAKIRPAKKTKQILSKRVAHLASVGLLQQQQQPEESQLMVTAANALPDELLTIVQVLMMTESEFKQLQQADQDEKQDTAAAAAVAAAAGSSEQQQNGSVAHQSVTLNLGRDMLEDEFGELCGAVLLQAVDRWCARYPHDLKASLSALEASQPGSRPWLAAAVCVGEQLLLQQLKKGALMIMLGAAQGEDEDEEGEEFDLGSSDDAELSEGEEGDSEHEELAAAAAAAGGSKKRSRKEVPEEQHKHSSKHKQHHHDKHKHKQHKRRSGGKDDRPHYGDMTGPAEADVWQSDDSDKVGYSSESDDEGDRHPVDPSEHHTYEVGAAGAVREAHGHMLGPDESALIESDDSDKVGYADEGDEPAAAAAAADAEQGKGRKGRSAARSGSKRGKQAAEAAAGGSKKPKRGLGYKG